MGTWSLFRKETWQGVRSAFLSVDGSEVLIWRELCYQGVGDVVPAQSGLYRMSSYDGSTFKVTLKKEVYGYKAIAPMGLNSCVSQKPAKEGYVQ